MGPMPMPRPSPLEWECCWACFRGPHAHALSGTSSRRCGALAENRANRFRKELREPAKHTLRHVPAVNEKTEKRIRPGF
jgi:hypothetical protein